MKQILFIMMLSLIGLVSGAQSKDSSAVKKITTGTQTDTVVKAYFLSADNLQAFQLLYAAVATPKDVTPNQVELLVKWIREGLRAVSDTISGGTKKP